MPDMSKYRAIPLRLEKEPVSLSSILLSSGCNNSNNCLFALSDLSAITYHERQISFPDPLSSLTIMEPHGTTGRVVLYYLGVRDSSPRLVTNASPTLVLCFLRHSEGRVSVTGPYRRSPSRPSLGPRSSYDKDIPVSYQQDESPKPLSLQPLTSTNSTTRYPP